MALQRATAAIPGLINGAIASLRPKLNTAWKYARVELAPPKPSEFGEAMRGFGNVRRSFTSGAWKNVTVRHCRKLSSASTVFVPEVITGASSCSCHELSVLPAYLVVKRSRIPIAAGQDAFLIGSVPLGRGAMPGNAETANKPPDVKSHVAEGSNNKTPLKIPRQPQPEDVALPSQTPIVKESYVGEGESAGQSDAPQCAPIQYAILAYPPVKYRNFAAAISSLGCSLNLGNGPSAEVNVAGARFVPPFIPGRLHDTGITGAPFQTDMFGAVTASDVSCFREAESPLEPPHTKQSCKCCEGGNNCLFALCRLPLRARGKENVIPGAAVVGRDFAVPDAAVNRAEVVNEEEVLDGEVENSSLRKRKSERRT
ncbi:unnamed protein product [Cyprideis torosa]|uniref:Uncharacterized protein n=1 Tax=Cyprideis torosa TaxID=163714 RepID=A0A7R8W5C4_9CRUS|nr:unnamed protein product [Cyprideis torosa]CAG0885123.1 unnamed protein product [Cyprideis torosa]